MYIRVFVTIIICVITIIIFSNLNNKQRKSVMGFIIGAIMTTAVAALLIPSNSSLYDFFGSLHQTSKEEQNESTEEISSEDILEAFNELDNLGETLSNQNSTQEIETKIEIEIETEPLLSTDVEVPVPPVKEGWMDESEEIYFYENGIKAVGWRIISDKYYYFDYDGTMLKNLWVGNFYLSPYGYRYVNTIETIDDIEYSFDSYGNASIVNKQPQINQPNQSISTHVDPNNQDPQSNVIEDNQIGNNQSDTNSTSSQLSTLPEQDSGSVPPNSEPVKVENIESTLSFSDDVGISINPGAEYIFYLNGCVTSNYKLTWIEFDLSTPGGRWPYGKRGFNEYGPLEFSLSDINPTINGNTFDFGNNYNGDFTLILTVTDSSGSKISKTITWSYYE